MTNKQSFWTIVWDVVKFILTLGISHINKRKEKLSSEYTPEQPEFSELLQRNLNPASEIEDGYLKK